MRTTTLATGVLWLAALLGASAHAETCAERYFAPDDLQQARPLASPHAELKQTQALALKGSPAHQRSLGAMYEAGYLVSACAEKAVYWYDAAARSKDEIALAWIERNGRMENLRRGPECFAGGCLGGVSTTPSPAHTTAVLTSARGGHYHASVTINGKSVRGIIDTGATFISMSAKTAAELGVDYSGGREVMTRTANGPKRNRAVMLKSVTVENITLDNVEAIVGESDHPLLIGMTFLNRVSMTSNAGTLTLVKR
ncbi:MAG TPA: TIGR02281 family clan AA aspartic protease [Burkholderiales bacterium]|nr:TIGR02281 family clan AA aspartic protease [Burkholderiales bacterium]